MAVMLYKHPGKHPMHGDMFDYIVVDEDGVSAALKDGWSKTTDEAKAPKKPAKKRAVKAKAEEE